MTPQLVPLKITSHRGKGGAQDFPREAMETKWKGQKTKEVDNTGFKLWYTETVANKNGV